MESKTIRGTFTVDEARLNGRARPPERQVPAFEELLVRLSARFINLPASQVDQHIEDGLRQIVEVLGLDRSSFGVFVEGRDLHLAHSYARPGYPPLPPVMMHQQFPWLVGTLLSGCTVRVERAPEDLPEEAVQEQEYYRRTGLRGQLTIPIAVEGAPLCVLGVASFTEPRRWDDLLEARLRLLGEVFANAIARKNLQDARRESEEHSRRLRSELARAGRVTALGEAAASLAHEMNQPLCAILANARSALRLLDGDPRDVDEVRAALADIAGDADRATQIIAHTRTLLRKGAPVLQPLDLNDLVRDVVTLSQHDLVDRHVTVRMQLAESLPPVAGDRVQLQQVVLNLLLNAAESMDAVPDGQREVTISSEARDGMVRLVVSDRGPGLAPALARRCFDPFFSTRPGGMGMGLAICRSIVEAHDGQIAADGSPGSGAAFTMTLRGAEGIPATQSGPLVLIVDDDPSVRAALVRLLRGEGMTARAFASPTEFLGRPLGDVPTCLVLDLQMPELNGLEVQAAIAAREVPLPVVFLTGHGDIPTSVRAMKAGAVDFLIKPIDERSLLKSVRQGLRQHEAALLAHGQVSRARERLARLTPREHQVLAGVVAGRLNKQIAADLDIAEKTVKVHRAHVMGKLEAGSVAELVRILALTGDAQQ